MTLPSKSISVIGATGTIGRAVVGELGRRGFAVVCLARASAAFAGATGRYDVTATPSTGSDTLFDYYRNVLAGAVVTERRPCCFLRQRIDCAVFPQIMQIANHSVQRQMCTLQR